MKIRIVLWHILGCVIFLSSPILLSPHPPEQTNFITSPPTIRDFLANGILLVFFYSNYYLLIPSFYFKKRYLLYWLCITLGLLAVCILPPLATGRNLFDSAPALIINGNLPPMPRPAGSTFIHEIQHLIYLFATVALFSILLRTRGRLILSEQAKHNSEIRALKDQINPHFLFNTLNGLYGLAVRDKSTATATGILKLSSMMRYVVTETGNGFVSLEKEIAYINDYIELQKLRLPKNVNLSYRVIGAIDKHQVAPLTLMPFIENAFKHGVNPDEDSSINILIEVNQKEIKLIVENNKVNVMLSPHERSGRGIANTKSRLNLLYSSRHFLILNEDEKTFRVQLTIEIP